MGEVVPELVPDLALQWHFSLCRLVEAVCLVVHPAMIALVGSRQITWWLYPRSILGAMCDKDSMTRICGGR